MFGFDVPFIHIQYSKDIAANWCYQLLFVYILYMLYPVKINKNQKIIMFKS